VEDNIKMGIRYVYCEDRMWKELSQDRVQWRYLEVIGHAENCNSVIDTFLTSTLYALGNAKVN
jgi:hypothetical protein